MRLKTHTAYPETNIDGDTFDFVTNIYTPDSKVLATNTGTADSYDEARDKAYAWVLSVADDYLIPAEEEE